MHFPLRFILMREDVFAHSRARRTYMKKGPQTYLREGAWASKPYRRYVWGPQSYSEGYAFL